MDNKRGLAGFIFLFAFIFLIGNVSSAACSVTTFPCPAQYPNLVMKLSSTSNAHGALYSQGGYSSALCCDFAGTNSCSGSNKVLKLSSTTNAHAEIPSKTDYVEPVCFGTLICTSGSTCTTDYPIAMLSLSSDTNAHLGSFSTYPTKICCATISSPQPTCGDGKIEAPETCDDGNTASGDGCSYPACTVESGYTCYTGTNGASICYPANPSTYWVINGYQVNAGETKDIAYWNSILMFVEDDLGLSNGATVTFDIYDTGGKIATVAGTVDTVYNRISSAWYNVPQPFLDALASAGENVYFVMTGGGRTITGDTIKLIPKNCVLTSASWSTTGPVVAGTSVKLNIAGTNCGSKTITFEIKEKDGSLNPDDNVATFSRVYSSPDWITIFQDDTDGGQSNPPEYFFKASVDTMSNPVESSNTDVNDPLMLRVTQGCVTNGICTSPEENCANCPQDCGCSAGSYCDGIVCTPYCLLISGSWNATSVPNGTKVRLNIEGNAYCNNEQIAFSIFEYDAVGGDDLARTNPTITFPATGTTAFAEWFAEWPEPPEALDPNPKYYFSAAFTGTSDYRGTSNNPYLEVSWCGNNKIEGSELCDGTNLNGETCSSLVVGSTGTLTCTSTCTFNTNQCIVEPDVKCTAISSCDSYTTEIDCNADGCSVADDNAPGTIDCCGSFNPQTGCWDSDGCACSWDSAENKCKFSSTPTSSCNSCGNRVKDFGEECDDGNSVSNDGCSDSCKLEADILPPCPYGTTLCSDGTCSLNCFLTDTAVSICDYDNSCETGEGCTCSDCANAQDQCKDGLTCNIYNLACNAITDCEPDAVCGNGYKEKSEQCDLGIKNGVANSGCASDCKYALIDSTNGCPEGTTLCSDGTCSLNCYSTDKGVAVCDGDNTCDEGEGCTCSDCIGVKDSCITGLTCSIVDQSCCNAVPDNYCNSYCSYYDPDCAGIPGEVLSPGTCTWTDLSTDTCEDDGILFRDLHGSWTWNSENSFSANPDGSDNYWQPTGSNPWRYDPFNYLTGVRRSVECTTPIQDSVICPAQVEISFFSVYSLISTIIIIVLIYVVISLKKKNKAEKRRKK